MQLQLLQIDKLSKQACICSAALWTHSSLPMIKRCMTLPGEASVFSHLFQQMVPCVSLISGQYQSLYCAVDALIAFQGAEGGRTSYTNMCSLLQKWRSCLCHLSHLNTGTRSTAPSYTRAPSPSFRCCGWAGTSKTPDTWQPF